MSYHVPKKKPQEVLDLFLDTLSYDPETGEFTYLKGRQKGFVKKPSGACRRGKDGEWLYHKYVLHLDGKMVSIIGHHLAWFMHYGEWPDAELDHINRNGRDNRIDNLRKSNSSLQKKNRVIASKHGLGIKRHKSAAGVNRFTAQYKLDHLGTFSCKSAAWVAYDIAYLNAHPDEVIGANGTPREALADAVRFSEACRGAK